MAKEEESSYKMDLKSIKDVIDMKIENAVKLGLIQSSNDSLQKWMFILTYKYECITKSIKQLKELLNDMREDIKQIRTYFLDIGYDLHQKGGKGYNHYG